MSARSSHEGGVGKVDYCGCFKEAVPGDGRRLEDGLLDKLAKHIGDFYAREIPQQVSSY